MRTRATRGGAQAARLLLQRGPPFLVLRHGEIRILRKTVVVEDKPDHFGDEPDTYHCDAIFLMGISASSAMTAFNPREGVDRIWPGEGVIYSQRLSAQRTKSRLSTVMNSPLYKSMTIRSWSTTVKLNNRLSALDESR
jgi:uncharacterized protein (DUF1697 family)